MYGVNYKNDELYMENVSVKEIAETVGTPAYIYSFKKINENFNAYVEAFSDINPIICYSTKANSNIAVLKIYSNLVAGFDIVSGGELRRVLRAGADNKKIVFSGVGKSDDEIIYAIESDILFFNVESIDELKKINSIALKLKKKAPIALRVNPDIDPKTHPYISTGFKKSKFGIEIHKALDVYRNASKMEGLNIVAIDAHIGSQIFDLSSFIDSLRKLIELARSLENDGIEIKYLDMGGGLGISYKPDENPPTAKQFADLIIKELSGTHYRLVLEPGRSLIGNSGVLATQVLYTKQGSEKKFVIVDAAMNDLVRPAFYNSYHEILPVIKNASNKEVIDIVGPVCESGDFLALDREFPTVNPGEYLAVLSSGAYGFVMASNYNSRTRSPEVLVKDDKFFIIKERENFEDLIKGENIPEFLG